MDVIKNRYVFMAISGIFFAISLFFLFFGKLNLAIDMTGGIHMDYQYNTEINIDTTRQKLESLKTDFNNKYNNIINNVEVYKVTGEKTLSVIAGFQDGIQTDAELDEIKLSFKNTILSFLQESDKSVKEVNYTNIGKSFGDYIKSKAFQTLWIALVAIALYIIYSFSSVVSGISPISFWWITLVTLFHDVIIASWLYIILSLFFKDFQIDTYFVTALLTILGYSINDTIIVFDRIRENLMKFGGKKGKKGRNLEEIVNEAVNATIKRSIYTSLTLVFVLLTIFFFGPESLRGFILVMVFGTFVGTYSSIFIAAPLLYEINKNKKLQVYKKKVVNPEDKIVV